MRLARSALVLALLAPALALPGCTADRLAALPPSRQPGPVPPPGCTAASTGRASARWWRCLGDAQLSALIDLAMAPSPARARLTVTQHSLAGAVADRYIALRAAQSALVLLAAREELDARGLALARSARNPAREPVAAAATQLTHTRTDQARTRDAVAALRERLAVLTGALLATLPGGPVPLPPPVVGAPGAPGAVAGGYAAARVTADRAQAGAIAARSLAASAETLATDRRALDALQAEEQARAAMSRAYVALAAALRSQ